VKQPLARQECLAYDGDLRCMDMKRNVLLTLSILLLAPLIALAAAPTKAPSALDMPKVLLVGDTIGYAPLVAKRLAGKAVVVNPPGKAK